MGGGGGGSGGAGGGEHFLFGFFEDGWVGVVGGVAGRGWIFSAGE